MFWLKIERESPVPMIRQVYGGIRKRILDGRLAPGTRLPASRELALQMAVSRNVVLEAYDLLQAEGYIESRPGSGTFVAAGAVYDTKPSVQPPRVDQVTMGYEAPAGIINFRAGTPDLEQFPTTLWLRMLKQVLAGPPASMLAYGHPEGRIELREAIAEYVVSQREIVCHPDQIVITAGTTQAIGLICQLLLRDRQDIILEDPITRDIQLIAENQGARLFPVPVDDEGMRTDLLPPSLSPALVYVTPSHQFPIGGTLPIQRRIDLLRYARRQDCFIVEDDYDSEFRFDGPPLSALHGLAPDRVIYIGTFSKTLCPAIRIGYLILPPDLISHARNRKWQNDLHNETTSQLALAAFIREGHYLRHVNRMRKQYRQRRQTLVRALERHFADRLRILGSATGLHLVACFRDQAFDNGLLARIEAAGVRVYPVEIHAIEPNRHRNALLLGYGSLTPAEIETGTAILAHQLS